MEQCRQGWVRSAQSQQAVDLHGVWLIRIGVSGNWQVRRSSRQATITLTPITVNSSRWLAQGGTARRGCGARRTRP